jgi:hypothetical protein
MTMSGLMNCSPSAWSPVGRNSRVKRSMVRLLDSAVVRFARGCADPAVAAGERADCFVSCACSTAAPIAIVIRLLRESLV